MTREQIERYRHLNADDQKTFRLWIIANAVAGALVLFALIAAAFFSTDDGTNVATAQKDSRSER